MASFFTGLPRNVQGALWLLGAGVFLSAMGVFIKLISVDMHPFQIAFFRCFFGLLIIAPFALKGGLSAVKTRRPGLHLMRGLIGGVVLLMMFYSVAHLPLADVTALSFTKPLFLIPLAALFLAERIRMRRTLATAVGFCGVLIMLRPGGDVEAVALLTLAATVLIAVITILMKLLSRYDSPNTLVFWSSLVISLTVLGPALYYWRTPDWDVFLMLVGLAVVGTIGQSMMVRGYAVGEAVAVTPFDYGRLIYAGLFGFFIFAETPDIWTISGALVIVASSIYIARREAQVKSGAKTVAATFDGPAGAQSPEVVRHGYPALSAGPTTDTTPDTGDEARRFRETGG